MSTFRVLHLSSPRGILRERVNGQRVSGNPISADRDASPKSSAPTATPFALQIHNLDYPPSTDRHSRRLMTGVIETLGFSRRNAAIRLGSRYCAMVCDAPSASCPPNLPEAATTAECASSDMGPRLFFSRHEKPEASPGIASGVRMQAVLSMDQSADQVLEVGSEEWLSIEQ